MSLKLFIPVLFFIAFVFPAHSQDNAGNSNAERQADSILKRFLNEGGSDPRFEDETDTARLRQAEEDYMNNFLKLERNPKKELQQKRILQVLIGLILLIGFFTVLRKRRRK